MNRLVLFDLDGTLIDSAPDLCAAANALRAQWGLAPLSYDALREWAGAGARGLLWAALRLRSEAAVFDAQRQAFLQTYEAHMLDQCACFDGVLDMLASLEAAGHRWGIVTNKSNRYASPICSATGLDRAVCCISGSDMGQMKPLPGALLAGMAAAGAQAEQTVYVGDDARDARCAQAAGVRFIAATWGYTGAGAPADDWGADALAARPTDIVSIIDRLL